MVFEVELNSFQHRLRVVVGLCLRPSAKVLVKCLISIKVEMRNSCVRKNILKAV